MACVYIIYSKNRKRFYIGSSRKEDARLRLKYHNWGKTKSTKSGRPWKLIWEETQENYTEARKKENFLKTGVGRKWIYQKFGN